MPHDTDLGAKSNCPAAGPGSKRATPPEETPPEIPVDPLKAAAATLLCLALFWLAFRLTRRLVDLAIAGGYAEERRRLAEEEAAQAEAGAVPQASAIRATSASLASNRDQSSAAAIGAHSPSTSSISRVQGAAAK
ncbi:hypothetical protein SAMN05216360_11160 [Methylobacterium phyllostachyos]|uniref:Uncharacterized protein n=1 Tax=Methylobacterium phyllostachyos TaxID=582672 RepID=A0A1H0E5Q6_9HYPH|nr:hypothetical protein SAMN05216360_11160 [Methylobacterium phyllostachyos]